jgi:hypothetical protein
VAIDVQSVAWRETRTWTLAAAAKRASAPARQRAGPVLSRSSAFSVALLAKMRTPAQ